MVTKTNGTELKKFYTDTAAWPDGAWHEEEEIVVNGISVDEFDTVDILELKDEDIVTVNGGYYYLAENSYSVSSFEAHFKKWRKAQKIAMVTVTVPQEKVKEFNLKIKDFISSL